MQGSANARSLRVSKSKKKLKLNIVAIILKGTLGHHNFSLQKASNIRRNALFEKLSCYKCSTPALEKQFVLFPHQTPVFEERF